MKIPFLHGWLMRYAYQHQPTTDEFKYMEFAFIDSRGKKYYKYSDYFNLPLPRREELEKLLLLQAARINNEDLDNWIESMEHILSQPKREDAIVQGLQMLGGLKLRRDVKLETDLLFSMCACVYICEDQNPTIWNEEYENKKIQELKKDFSERGGLRDFFLKAGFADCIPSWVYTEDGLKKYSENQAQQIQTFTDMVKRLKDSLTGIATTGR